MIKRNFKVMAALALTLSLGTGFMTTHAATLSSTESNTTTKIEQKIYRDKDHKGSISSVLNKLGVTDAQIDSAKKSNKTAFDLAKEKGVTPDQLRAMILDAKLQKIDEEVKAGSLTKEKADTKKSNLKDKIQKWNGSFKQDDHKKGFYNFTHSVLKDKLNYTDEQIDNAKKSGKTAFDLTKEKGVTPDQFRSMVLTQKSQKIDKAVNEGKFTKEKADSIKADLKDKIQKWDGSFEHKNDVNKSE